MKYVTNFDKFQVVSPATLKVSNNLTVIFLLSTSQNLQCFSQKWAGVFAELALNVHQARPRAAGPGEGAQRGLSRAALLPGGLRVEPGSRPGLRLLREPLQLKPAPFRGRCCCSRVPSDRGWKPGSLRCSCFTPLTKSPPAWPCLTLFQ